MYKIESIKKVMAIATEYRIEYEKDIDNVKPVISSGNRKIGLVLNVSLMPIMTCAHCKECMYYCYDIKACLQYSKTVIAARMKNTVLAINAIDRYFAAIDDKMSRRRRNKYFRFHVAGDILNMDYLKRMIEIARKHPDFTIWTYTKYYEVVNEYIAEMGGNVAAAIPENLHIMFSKWDGLPLVNPYHLPVFACKLKAGNKDKDFDFSTAYKCPGNCDVCKANGRGCIAGENTYADEH